MTYSALKRSRMDKGQRGFALIQVMIAILILTFMASLGAQKYVSFVNDAAAESTGRYLISVRTAVIKALSNYDAAFTMVDTSSAPPGVYPSPPAWAVFSGAKTTLSVKDLKTSKLLSDSFPDRPPIGRSVHVQIQRSGVCPGADCALAAYVYTCWPMNSFKPAGAVDITTCPAPPAGSDYDVNMVGAAIGATDGYGATNYLVPATMRGPLFSVSTTSLGLGANSPGHIAVLATLNDSMFSQFVRQGDTRHIILKDGLSVGESLSVAKQVTAGEGLLLPTNSVVGQICPTEGTYGTSTRGSFVICSGGRWFEMINHMLLSTKSLANGADISPPVCGPTMQPFASIAMQALDVTMTGSDISVKGMISGNIVGSGGVSTSGAVSVTGVFSGETTSLASSRIRVAQSASIVDSKVVITPPSTTARALVMQGCRYL